MPSREDPVQGLLPPQRQLFLGSSLMLCMHPDPERVFFRGRIVFVSGELPGGVHVILELCQARLPLLVQCLLFSFNIPTGDAAQQDYLGRGQVPSLGGQPLPFDPCVQSLFVFLAVTVGETLIRGVEVLDFLGSPSPPRSWAVTAARSPCVLMTLAKTRAVALSDLKMPVHGTAWVMAPVGYLPHRQAGLIHEVPFGMP